MQMGTHAGVGACVDLSHTVNQPAEYALIGGTLALIGEIISDIDVGDTLTNDAAKPDEKSGGRKK